MITIVDYNSVLIYNDNMRMRLGKHIWLVVVIAAIISLLAASSVGAATQKLSAQVCDSQCQPGHSIPLCCLIAESPLSNCILNSSVVSMVLPSSRSAPKQDVHLSITPNSLISQTAISRNNALQMELAQKLPSPAGAEARCRDSLSSEDPLSV